jgi:pimeloyl-ACP methyl ester carboxylesterase
MLHVLEWSRTGPPLLFVHGFGHVARIWDANAEHLADRYRTLALDARGHGDSDPDPQFRYHHAALTKDLESATAHLRLDGVTVVAHSMGGYAAIRFASRQPERVARLVLVDAGPQLSASSRAAASAEREPPDASYASAEEFARVLARRHPRARPDALARLAPHALRRRSDGRFVPKMDPTFLRPKSASDPAHRRSFDRERWAREETERLWEHLGRVRCPTLVIRGEHSPMLSAATVDRMVNEVLADGRAAVVPGAGHAVMLDAPEAFAAALYPFLGA